METPLRFLTPVLRRIVRGSDAVTAIATPTAGLLRRLAPGAEPVIVPFGAAVEPRDVRQFPSPARYGPLRLLFVGRLVERKGVHVLLDAVSRLAPESRPEVEIIGEGPERARLERMADERGIAEGVRFLGFVPEEALEGALAGCDALVLPAVQDAKGDVEGLGVVLLEAMAFARPVIASASGGITDIVRDGENGLLTPPGDASALASAIQRLSADRERAREMGRAGLEAVRGRFSWNAIVDRLVEVYRGAAAPRAATGSAGAAGV
jgi:glycosyltransferase involved in cell wall biosynthesis